MKIVTLARTYVTVDPPPGPRTRYAITCRTGVLLGHVYALTPDDALQVWSRGRPGTQTFGLLATPNPFTGL